MIRIGFWGFLIIIIVCYTPKPYSNCLGPYIKASSFHYFAKDAAKLKPSVSRDLAYEDDEGHLDWLTLRLHVPIKSLGCRVQGLGFRA